MGFHILYYIILKKKCNFAKLINDNSKRNGKINKNEGKKARIGCA